MQLDKTIKQLAEDLRNKKVSSVELTQEAFEQIQKLNPKLNSFITVVEKEVAVAAARKADKELSETSSKLHGIPFSLKDAYSTKDVQTTAASNVLKGYEPRYSATVYNKVLQAGGILLGKNNMDAWGHGGSTENTDFGVGHNPWDLEKVPGGSSGGVAAAIAARMTGFAIGEDTGGSIRNPSAWCNTTGLKVSYGLVSRYGSIAYASSFDTVGPMGKTAEDCALILDEITGQDLLDASSAQKQKQLYSTSLDQSIQGKTIGIPKEFFAKGLNSEIRTAIESAAKEFEKLGCKIKEVSFPLFDLGVAIYYVIGLSETSSNMARYDGVRYGSDRKEFSEETMRRIMIGTYALSTGYYDAYYRQAQKARTLLVQAYDKLFSECDLIISPVTPDHPAKIGDLINDPLKSYLADMYTVTQNPAGVPSLALPAGFSKENLPIGMQLIGPMFSEAMLLNVGHQYQQVTDWHLRKPPILNDK